jgi:hypothetical protein
MKHLRQLSAAVVLTCALALSASAGDMHTGIVSPTPPETTGQMSAGVTNKGDMDAGVTQIAASLIQGVLALV